jgi:hypothetical protein
MIYFPIFQQYVPIMTPDHEGYLFVRPGPYYPLGAIGTVPRAYEPLNLALC